MIGARDPLGLVGQLLDGQYRIDEFVGEGGFSVVYRGFHTGLGEIIAIKCLKLQTSLQLGSALVESFVRRFRDEGRILYRLSQGNLHIVRSIASGTTIAPTTGSLVPYTVLEWLEGHSLAQDFDRRRAAAMRGRSPMEAALLFSTAFEAVAYAHDQGVVHRDLNPGNIFLTQTREGVRAKVLDFGVAKIVSDHALELGPRAATIGQIRMFSPAYAAPEQFDEKLGKPGPYTDVYTISLVFVEALRDMPAIEGENIATLIDQTLNPTKRPTPRTLGVDVPDALENVFVRALALKPETRPQNAGQLWVEIAAALKIRNVALPAPSSLLKTPPPATAVVARKYDPSRTVRMDSSSEISTSAPTVAVPLPVAPDPSGFASTMAAPSGLAAKSSQNDGQFSATMLAPDLTQPPQQQQQRQQPPQTVSMQGPSAWAGGGAPPSAPQMFQAAPQQQQQQPSNPQFPPPPIVAIARDANASGSYSDQTNVISGPPPSKAPLVILVVVALLGILGAAFLFRAKFHPLKPIATSASVSAIAALSASTIAIAQPSATVAPQIPATASSETPAVADSSSPIQSAAPPQSAAPIASDAPHASAVASHEAAPHASAAPVDPDAFDAAAAQHSLGNSDSILVSCADAKGQKGVAHVTFNNDGSVQKVLVDPPLGGTPAGDCVSSRYKFAHAPKYLGAPATVDHSFHVPK